MVVTFYKILPPSPIAFQFLMFLSRNGSMISTKSIQDISSTQL